MSLFLHIASPRTSLEHWTLCVSGKIGNKSTQINKINNLGKSLHSSLAIVVAKAIVGNSSLGHWVKSLGDWVKTSAGSKRHVGCISVSIGISITQIGSICISWGCSNQASLNLEIHEIKGIDHINCTHKKDWFDHVDCWSHHWHNETGACQHGFIFYTQKHGLAVGSIYGEQ